MWLEEFETTLKIIELQFTHENINFNSSLPFPTPLFPRVSLEMEGEWQMFQWSQTLLFAKCVILTKLFQFSHLCKWDYYGMNFIEFEN